MTASELDVAELARGLGLDAAGIARRLAYVELGPEDPDRIRALAPTIGAAADELTEVFFGFLAGLPEARGLLDDPDALAAARRGKRAHLRAMVEGPYDRAYAEERLALALIYARAGLEARVFLGAFHRLLRAIAERARADGPGDVDAAMVVLEKIAFFDVALIVDALVYSRERVIQRQEEQLRRLSLPILQVAERLLLLPLVGTIDHARARALTERLLGAVRATRARAVVIDLTGSTGVDAAAASYLVSTAAAAGLMGAEVILCGASLETATALVDAGVDPDRLRTASDLQGGIEEAGRILRRVGPDAGAIAVAARTAESGAPG